MVRLVLTPAAMAYQKQRRKQQQGYGHSIIALGSSSCMSALSFLLIFGIGYFVGQWQYRFPSSWKKYHDDPLASTAVTNTPAVTTTTTTPATTAISSGSTTSASADGSDQPARGTFPRMPSSFSNHHFTKKDDAMNPIHDDNDGWTTIDVFYGKVRDNDDNNLEIHSKPTTTTANTTSTTATTTTTVDSSLSSNHRPLNNKGDEEGSSSSSSTSSSTRYYSQANQDQAVLTLLQFQRQGYFIDLAANDPIYNSNTYALERQYGWTGLCIEPNPMYWYNFTRYRPTCTVVGAVIGSQQQRKEMVPFVHQLGDHGGIVATQPKKDIHNASTLFNNGYRYRHSATMEYTVPFQEVLERYHVPTTIDYLSLDVEGAEEYIMEDFPFEVYTIRVMTIERATAKLKNRLEKFGYHQVIRLSPWGEFLWAHDDVLRPILGNVTQLLEPFDSRIQRWKAKARKQQP